MWSWYKVRPLSRPPPPPTPVVKTKFNKWRLNSIKKIFSDRFLSFEMKTWNSRMLSLFFFFYTLIRQDCFYFQLLTRLVFCFWKANVWAAERMWLLSRKFLFFRRKNQGIWKNETFFFFKFINLILFGFHGSSFSPTVSSLQLCLTY